MAFQVISDAKPATIPARGRQLEASHFLLGAGVVGILTTCWQYIKTFAWKFCNLLIREVQISGNVSCPAETIFIDYFEKNFKRSKVYDYLYFISFARSIKSREYEMVACERIGSQTLIYWNKWIPFIYQVKNLDENGQSGNQPKLVSSESFSDPRQEHYSIRIFYIRGMLDIERIIKEATASQNRKLEEERKLTSNTRYRFCIYQFPGEDQGSQYKVSNAGPSVPELNPWYTKRINRLLTHKSDELGQRREGKQSCLDSLYFPKHVKDLIAEIKMWRDSKKWHEERNIPYQRGWLLYGPGGTGKTELARAFGQDLDMPIISMNLSQMTNETLRAAWNHAKCQSPCIVLLEDFDNVFHGRKNITASNFGMFSPLMMEYGPTGGPPDEKQSTPNRGQSSFCVTFDVLLNCIDGVDKGSGIFLIITTNDISKIDEALGVPRKKPDGTHDLISTRPGRIDRAIELTYMETELKRQMAKDYLSEFPEALSEFLEGIDANPDYKETPAQVKYQLAQIALRIFYERKNIKPDPEEVAETTSTIQIPLPSIPDESPKVRIRKKWFRKQAV